MNKIFTLALAIVFLLLMGGLPSVSAVEEKELKKSKEEENIFRVKNDTEEPIKVTWSGISGRESQLFYKFKVKGILESRETKGVNKKNVKSITIKFLDGHKYRYMGQLDPNMDIDIMKNPPGPNFEPISKDN